MALGDGTTWDETTPTNLTVATHIDDYNRELKIGVRGRMALEHEWPSSQAATSEAGVHKFITMQDQAVKPTVSGTQVSAVYAKSSGTANELFFENSAGNEVQLTIGTGLAGARIDVSSAYAVTDITCTAAAFATMTGMAITMTGSGTYILAFEAPLNGASDTYSWIELEADSVSVATGSLYYYGRKQGSLLRSVVLTDSAHAFLVNWKTGNGGAVTQLGDTFGGRSFVVTRFYAV